MPQVTSQGHRDLVGRLRSALGAYKEAEDLINIGAYADGSNPRIDEARRLIEPIRRFLRQGTHEVCDFESTIQSLEGIFADEAL